MSGFPKKFPLMAFLSGSVLLGFLANLFQSYQEEYENFPARVVEGTSWMNFMTLF